MGFLRWVNEDCPLWHVPEVAPDVVALILYGWPDHYGPTGSADPIDAVRRRIRRAGLPFGVVAMDGDDVIGTAALAQTSFGAQDAEGPWLIGLIVTPSLRRRGVAGKLVAGLEDAAKQMEHRQIYTTTMGAVGVFQRRGWTNLRHVADDTGLWNVMRCDII